MLLVCNVTFFHFICFCFCFVFGFLLFSQELFWWRKVEKLLPPTVLMDAISEARSANLERLSKDRNKSSRKEKEECKASKQEQEREQRDMGAEETSAVETKETFSKAETKGEESDVVGRENVLLSEVVEWFASIYIERGASHSAAAEKTHEKAHEEAAQEACDNADYVAIIPGSDTRVIAHKEPEISTSVIAIPSDGQEEEQEISKGGNEDVICAILKELHISDSIGDEEIVATEAVSAVAAIANEISGQRDGEGKEITSTTSATSTTKSEPTADAGVTGAAEAVTGAAEAVTGAAAVPHPLFASDSAAATESKPAASGDGDGDGDGADLSGPLDIRALFSAGALLNGEEEEKEEKELKEEKDAVEDDGMGWRSNESAQQTAMQTAAVLPIAQHRLDVLRLVASSRVCVIEGETGSGKSSQVPQYILKAYETDECDPTTGEPFTDPCMQTKGKAVNIIVTQSRRIAVVSLARRVAEELGEGQFGGKVGFVIGGERANSHRTRITFATTGYLTELLAHCPEAAQRYTHVILDEVHERSADGDVLLLLLRQLLSTYAHLRVILMSATIQGDLLLQYFNTDDIGLPRIPPPLHVGAMRFPVQEIFLDDLPEHLIPSIPTGFAYKFSESLQDFIELFDTNPRLPVFTGPKQHVWSFRSALLCVVL
jgi:hypothetical protein